MRLVSLDVMFEELMVLQVFLVYLLAFFGRMVKLVFMLRELVLEVLVAELVAFMVRFVELVVIVGVSLWS